MYFFFGNLCMCSFAATIATLFFESPFIGLEKIIFGRTSSLERNKTASVNDNDKSTADKGSDSTESTSLENATKISEDNKPEEAKNGSIYHPPKTEIHQQSFRQKSYDNVAYEP